jgi:hypothetical protein
VRAHKHLYTNARPAIVINLLTVLGLELRALYLLGGALIAWATPSAHFCEGFFWDRVSWTICPGWPWISILLISASWVSGITGGSHQHPAQNSFYFNFLRGAGVWTLGFALALSLGLHPQRTLYLEWLRVCTHGPRYFRGCGGRIAWAQRFQTGLDSWKVRPFLNK